MIKGIVTPYAQARVSLTVLGHSGQERIIEAVIDTGFAGMLSLPTVYVAELGLSWRRRGRALLADGSATLFDVYEATVIWDGIPRRVSVDCTEVDPLVGMRLMYGYELGVQVFAGGQVTIKPFR